MRAVAASQLTCERPMCVLCWLTLLLVSARDRETVQNECMSTLELERPLYATREGGYVVVKRSRQRLLQPSCFSYYGCGCCMM
jgi:hypothetical protein